MRWIAMATAAMMTGTTAAAEREIWLVFTPECRIDPASLKAIPKPARLVLVVEDFSTGALPGSFLRSLVALQEWLGPDFRLPVADRDAISTLRALGLRRAPALLVFHRGTVHITEGLPRNSSEVLQCTR